MLEKHADWLVSRHRYVSVVRFLWGKERTLSRRNEEAGCSAGADAVPVQLQATPLFPFQLLHVNFPALSAWLSQGCRRGGPLTCLVLPLARWRWGAAPHDEPQGGGGLGGRAPQAPECVPYRVVVHSQEEQRCALPPPRSQALDLLICKMGAMAAPASQGGGENHEGQACSYHSRLLTPVKGPSVYTLPGWETKQAVGSVGQGQEVSNLAAHWSHLHPILEGSNLILLGSNLGGLMDL